MNLLTLCLQQTQATWCKVSRLNCSLFEVTATVSIEHFSHKVIINYTKSKIIQNNNNNNNHDIDIHTTTEEHSVNVSSKVKIIHDY